MKKVRDKLAQNADNSELQERAKAREVTLKEAEAALAILKANTEAMSPTQASKPTITDAVKKAKINLAIAKSIYKEIRKSHTKSRRISARGSRVITFSTSRSLKSNYST